MFHVISIRIIGSADSDFVPATGGRCSSLADVVRLAAGLSRSVAAFHERGVVHGRIGLSSVRFGEDGQARLIGFGPADDNGEPAADVAALGQLVLAELERVPRRAEPPDVETRQAISAIAQRAVAGELTAREMATECEALGRRQCTAGALGPRPQRARRRWPSLVGPVMVVTVAVVGATAAAMGVNRDGSSGATGPVLGIELPVTTTTARPYDYTDGILSAIGGRWALGSAGDIVALGDWDCDGTASVALLRPAIGAVYAFSRWADETADVAGDPLGVVDHGVGLLATDVNGDGCDELVVQHEDGSSTTMTVVPEA